MYCIPLRNAFMKLFDNRTKYNDRIIVYTGRFNTSLGLWVSLFNIQMFRHRNVYEQILPKHNTSRFNGLTLTNSDF